MGVGQRERGGTCLGAWVRSGRLSRSLVSVSAMDCRLVCLLPGAAAHSRMYGRVAVFY